MKKTIFFIVFFSILVSPLVKSSTSNSVNTKNLEISSTETLFIKNQENKKKKERLSRKERKALERKEKAIESYKGTRRYDDFTGDLSYSFDLTSCYPWYLGIYVRKGQNPAFRVRRTGSSGGPLNNKFEWSYINEMDIKVNDNSPIRIIHNNRDFGGWDRDYKQTVQGRCAGGVCIDSQWSHWEEKYNFMDGQSLAFLLQLALANKDFLDNNTPIEISLRGYKDSGYVTYSCSSAGAENAKFPLISLNFLNALKETETGSSLE